MSWSQNSPHPEHLLVNSLSLGKVHLKTQRLRRQYPLSKLATQKQEGPQLPCSWKHAPVSAALICSSLACKGDPRAGRPAMPASCTSDAFPRAWSRGAQASLRNAEGIFLRNMRASASRMPSAEGLPFSDYTGSAPGWVSVF